MDIAIGLNFPVVCRNRNNGMMKTKLNKPTCGASPANRITGNSTKPLFSYMRVYRSPGPEIEASYTLEAG